ncbi:MAG: alpha-mannosidase [Acidimicrobiales bacterium]
MVHVVPHTHWDREWYLPFPVFRMRLVELLDTLLPHLEADPTFAHFQLDGQLAVVDDYLEVRPAEAERLAALNRAGRISMGPWYTLPDEFLVSGETLVRDLRLGMDRAQDFGGAMTIGYLPDMFGHVAQMPQILAGFGFDDAVVWRGVPAAIGAPAFWWEAPDGTRIRAEYLPQGYGNGSGVPASGADLVDAVAAFRAANGPMVGDDVLWMNGADHVLPDARLGQVVTEADAVGDDHYVVSSLAEHLGAAPRNGLPTWKGELRSGARANLLMGVASCRVDVKQAAATAERWLERLAEPLAACWLAPAAWPGAFLDLAWRDVVRNAAHDSICGCSADEVNDAVLHRYAESTRVAEGIVERALAAALAVSTQDAIVVNPTARPRSGIVHAVVSGDVSPPHTQQLSVRPARQRTHSIKRRSAVAVVLSAVIDDPSVSQAWLEHGDETGDVTAVFLADRQPRSVDLAALRAEVEALAAADPEAALHLERRRPTATQEVLLRTDEVPGFGWRGLAPADLADHAVRAEGQGLTNGLVTLVPDQGDGTFSIDGLAGFGRLVDDGDAGDTYNWSPAAFDGPVVRPDDVDVLVAEAGPVRGRLEIVRRYRWPTHVARVGGETGRRVGEAVVSVTTVVELRAGEDLVRLSISFTNPSKDHRLRVLFPLPEPAATSVAECAFATVERGLDAEGGPNEAPLATYPSRRFVAAGGLLVVHDGTGEYELVDRADGGESGGDAQAVAITVLRSVGVISQGPMTMRALPAGPPTLTPAAQMLGDHRAEMVLHLGGREPYAVADEAFTPLQVARLPGGDGLGDPDALGQSLRVSGAEVSALRRRDDGRLELRAFETAGAPTTLRVAGRRGERTDLAGQSTGEPFEGELDLEPHRVVTLALDDAG